MSSHQAFVRTFRKVQTESKKLTKKLAETNCLVQRVQIYDHLLQVNRQLSDMQDLLIRAFNNYSEIDFNYLRSLNNE